MSWPIINNKMIEAVNTVLISGKLNQWNNNIVNEFEQKFANYIGTKYAVAVFNGTVALELCLKTLNIIKGDEVIVTPRSFIASASCCAWYGIKPIFVDVDINSQNITLENIKKAITINTKAIILVHLAGWPCELDEICNFAKSNNIYIIEDCAQAHGAKYKNKFVGSFGDINAWSFCQDKIITTGGEGGMITTNNYNLFKKAWSIKDHGKDYDKCQIKTQNIDFKWLHYNLGTNWRMLPIQAAIGIEAINEVDKWVEHRRCIANIYNNYLQNIEGVRITIPDNSIYFHSYYKYYFFIDLNKFKITRNKLLDLINKKNIIALVGSCGEIYKEQSLNNFAPNYNLPNTKILFDTSIVLLCDPSITKEIALKNILIIKDILLNNIIN